MKKLLLSIFILSFTFSLAQEKAKDVFSVKAGLVGVWISYEKALSPQFTINGELGYEGAVFRNSLISNKLNFAFTTTLSLEGRYYYNFQRRIEKERNTLNNAANFVGLEATYTPDWGTSSSESQLNVLRSFTIIPKYGLRRNLSKNLNFEFAVGPGYQWIEGGNSGVITAMDLRIGFVF